MIHAESLQLSSNSHPQVTAKPASEFPKVPFWNPAQGDGKMSQPQAPEVWEDWTSLRSLPVGKPVIRLLRGLNPACRGTPYLYANLLSILCSGAISHLCLLASKCSSAPQKWPAVELAPPRTKVTHRSTALLLYHKLWQRTTAQDPADRPPSPGRRLDLWAPLFLKLGCGDADLSLRAGLGRGGLLGAI